VEFTCSTVFSVKLTEIFEATFCTNYEHLFTLLPTFEKQVYLIYCNIPADTHTPHTHTHHTHTHHTHTTHTHHTHTHHTHTHTPHTPHTHPTHTPHTAHTSHTPHTHIHTRARARAPAHVSNIVSVCEGI
jgi:hypothetical protein